MSRPSTSAPRAGWDRGKSLLRFERHAVSLFVGRHGRWIRLQYIPDVGLCVPRRFQDERLATTEAKMHSDPRGFADDINQIAGRKRKTTVQSIRKNDGRVTTDTAEILSVFRDNYADIGRDSVPAGADFDLTTRQQKVDSVASIRDGPRPSGPPELNTPITVKEVQHAIKKQKDNACSPLDMITNSMLVHGARGRCCRLSEILVQQDFYQ